MTSEDFFYAKPETRAKYIISVLENIKYNEDGIPINLQYTRIGGEEEGFLSAVRPDFNWNKFFYIIMEEKDIMKNDVILYKGNLRKRLEIMQEELKKILSNI